MKIVLIRHLKVVRRRSFFLTSKEFDESIRRYDTSAVNPSTLKIQSEDFPVCYASTKFRAIETAKLIYNGNFIATDELVEVPNASPFIHWLKMPGLFRSIIGRLLWFFNYEGMPETRAGSMLRASEFIDHLLKTTHEDTLIVTHGFFMHCLSKVLRKKGFKGKISLFPKNVHAYAFTINSGSRITNRYE